MAKRPKKQPENLSRALQTTKRADELFWLGDGSEENESDYESPAMKRNRRMFKAMRQVLKAYEFHSGNVSATCLATGISRFRFYSWMNGQLPHHRYFQRMIERIRPGDARLDMAELAIDNAVREGNIIAAMFTLKTQGRGRGWIEPSKFEPPPVDNSAAVVAVRAYQMWLKDNPDVSEAEKAEWLSRFARGNGVDEREMVRTMRIQEISQEVQ